MHLGGDVERGLIALGFVFRGGSLRALLLRVEVRKHSLNVLIACGDLVFKMPVAFQGLLQTEEMLGAVIAHQTLGYCLAAGFDARIAQAGELGGFAFPLRMASIMANPLTPVMSLMTLCN